LSARGNEKKKRRERKRENGKFSRGPGTKKTRTCKEKKNHRTKVVINGKDEKKEEGRLTSKRNITRGGKRRKGPLRGVMVLKKNRGRRKAHGTEEKGGGVGGISFNHPVLQRELETLRPTHENQEKRRNHRKRFRDRLRERGETFARKRRGKSSEGGEYASSHPA